ncbi:hypothetical protein GOP47_0002853 [Adiantum capillus-veneris]|uniref:Folylpolyglutamate synthase n=1 Tax=Adiantum capillus-veneris TaxID=13818 RepID=A0A9D4ZRZ7_ADICA|nr:hypothetical protein GOP47_0002853 [Adiantum capillus-veneris]
MRALWKCLSLQVAMPCLLAWQACRRRPPAAPSRGVLCARLLHQHHSMSFQDAIATLNDYLARPRPPPLVRGPDSVGPSQRVVARFSLLFKYIEALELREPLSRLSVIHVAGTKGKGSTCAFTESILRSRGYRTGLFTSPHLVDIRERFRFNGNLVSEEVFAKNFWWCWNRLQAVTSSTLPMPWFFSFLTLLALKMFTLEKVDVAILEVGLGGLYDATNVVRTPSVCGIASLGYDHMDVLGNTLTEIATQKAGIFKAGVPAFSVPQPPEALEVLYGQARRLSVPLEIAPALESYGVQSVKLGLNGDHQRVNAALAVALCAAWEKKLCASKDLTMLQDGQLPDAYFQGLASTSWPGRGQIIHDIGFYPKKLSKANSEHCDGKMGTGRLTWYLDGAHTPESLEACAKWFSSSALRGSTKGNNTTDVNTINGNGCTASNGHHTAKGVDFQRVLLFSCMPKRDPQLLLPGFVETCTQYGLTIDLALFVPLLSTSDAIETRSVPDICANAMEAEPDLSWQIVLHRTWEALHNGSNVHSSIMGLSQLRHYLQDEKHGHLFHQCVLGTTSAVMPSLPAALNWLRFWASQNPVELQVLVTGSLYLIGDLLKIRKQGQDQDIESDFANGCKQPTA